MPAPETELQIEHDVKLPLERKTDRLSDAILELDDQNVTGVEWNEQKEKN